jgi:hypothetical protein
VCQVLDTAFKLFIKIRNQVDVIFEFQELLNFIRERKTNVLDVFGESALLVDFVLVLLDVSQKFLVLGEVLNPQFVRIENCKNVILNLLQKTFVIDISLAHPVVADLVQILVHYFKSIEVKFWSPEYDLVNLL